MTEDKFNLEGSSSYRVTFHMTNVEEIKLTNYKEVYCFCDNDVSYILVSREFLDTRFNKTQARKSARERK